MPATWTKYTLLPCYLHLSIYDDECAAENSIRFPDTLHLDHPSLEQISIKRVKSVEKGCVFPSMGLIFIRGQLFEKHIENLGKTNHGENSGTFECVQMIRQQADAPKCRKNITRQGISDDGKLLYNNGYLIFAYKTMEDMCTKDFAASWKTWTGARQLCQLLPDKYTVKRLSFFKKVHGSTQFAYLLIAQIADLMMDCAPALNVLNCLKPKICAFVGAYRIVTFKVDAVLCNALGLSEDQHLYMYTSSLKVNYSNHTAFASYPGYNEFRSEDEKKQVTKVESTEPESNRKSSETQTDPVERPTARRTLPRTISIYDFPSMKNSSTITHKETPDIYEPEPGTSTELQKAAEKSRLLDTCDYMMDKKASPIPVALVHPLPSSPTGVWVRKKPPRKVGCVMFEKKFPFPTKEPEVPEKSPDFDRRDAIERLIVDLVTDPKDDDKSAKEVIKSPRRAHSEARTNVERRKLNVPDDDSLLQRLKLNYFNSPDYTSAELREINSD